VNLEPDNLDSYKQFIYKIDIAIFAEEVAPGQAGQANDCLGSETKFQLMNLKALIITFQSITTRKITT